MPNLYLARQPIYDRKHDVYALLKQEGEAVIWSAAVAAEAGVGK